MQLCADMRASSSAVFKSSSAAPALRRQLPRAVGRLHRGGRSRLICRADEGIKDLLSRDKKLVGVIDTLPNEDAFAPTIPERGLAPEQPAVTVVDEVVGLDQLRGKGKGKQKRARAAATAAAAASTSVPAQGLEVDAGERAGESGPRTCREAIDAGLAAFAAGKHQEAVDLFSAALDLPGSGATRLAGSVREYACASKGEEDAALYNMACAYAALGQNDAALTCLEGLLDNGFDDFATIRSDPDLKPLQGPALEGLLRKYDNLINKLFSKKKKDDDATQQLPSFLRPW